MRKTGCEPRDRQGGAPRWSPGECGALRVGVRRGSAAQRPGAAGEPRRRRAAARHVPYAQHDHGTRRRVCGLLWGSPKPAEARLNWRRVCQAGLPADTPLISVPLLCMEVALGGGAWVGSLQVAVLTGGGCC